MCLTSRTDSKTLEELIVEAKRTGLTDKEIGDKFNVSFSFIEKAITKLTGVNVYTLDRQKKIKSIEPKKFHLERGTVWSFKSRGNWATHSGDYRGNWSPYIPRNAILRYSEDGETVLDCFCGSGATAVECKLLNRNFIGLDINPFAIELAKRNIDFEVPPTLFNQSAKPTIDLKVGNARDLSFIKNGSVDLICMHPPYADIIQYTGDEKQDLSFLEMDDFLAEMAQVAKENHRVLRDGRHCVMLIGDMRKKKHVIPLGFRLIDVYLQNGFVLKELIIKRQHNCRTTGFWYKSSIKHNFLLLAHEYLAVFQKSEDSNEAPVRIPTTDQNERIKPAHSSDRLETMTVWISTPKDWYSHMLANLIPRYDGKNYAIASELESLKKKLKDTYDLVLWDARSTFTFALKQIEHVLDSIEVGGYFVVLCEDKRRKDGTLWPAALRAEKIFSASPAFKVKEIVVISIENDLKDEEIFRDLVIGHKYLLVFQKQAA